MGVGHRRMMEFEDKAKVVAFDWGGAKFVQFLAALAVLPGSIWKNRINSTISLTCLLIHPSSMV